MQDGMENSENDIPPSYSEVSSSRHDISQDDIKNTIKAWYSQFAERQKIGFKHANSFGGLNFYEATHPVTKMGVQLAQLFVHKLLNLNKETLTELEKVNSYDFDIFSLRSSTNGNELATLVPFLFAKHGLVATNDVDFNKLMCFVRHLAAGYKCITYHN